MSPIDACERYNQELYLANRDPETRRLLSELIDTAHSLVEALDSLADACETITPTDEEFQSGLAAIDNDVWDDFDEAVAEAKKILVDFKR